MADNNLKSFSDENIINVISRIQSGSVAYNLSDVRAILTEVTERGMGQEYTDLLTGLQMRLSEDAENESPVYRRSGGQTALKSEESEEKDLFVETIEKPKKQKKVEKVEKIEKPKRKDTQAVEEFDELDYEAFPILVFLAGVYKTVGWVVFLLAVLASIVISIAIFPGQTLIISGIILGSIIVGTLTLLGCYAASENIWLKIEVERHLRRLK